MIRVYNIYLGKTKIKEVFPLVDGFQIEQVFEDRTYERQQFKFMVDGNEYRGHLQNGEIHWLNPDPTQVVGEAKLKAVEIEAYALLGEYGNTTFTDPTQYT